MATPRRVRIDAIDLLRYEYPLLELEVRCGKGTYIRSLARDIGSALTTHAACMTALRRTAIGPYRVEDATPLESLPAALTIADLKPALA